MAARVCASCVAAGAPWPRTSVDVSPSCRTAAERSPAPPGARRRRIAEPSPRTHPTIHRQPNPSHPSVQFQPFLSECCSETFINVAFMFYSHSYIFPRTIQCTSHLLFRCCMCVCHMLLKYYLLTYLLPIDSPDCLLLFLSISVLLFSFFSVLYFLVVVSVR